MSHRVIGLGGAIALIAVSLAVRSIALSGGGVPGYFYLLVPVGLIVLVLLALGVSLFTFFRRKGGMTQPWQQRAGYHWHHHGGVQQPPYGSPPVGSQPAPGYHPPLAYKPPAASPPPGYQAPPASPPPLGYQPLASPQLPAPQPPAPSVTQRLQELETLRASGAISETEYGAKRQEIISHL